ncbi:MAG TPA: hypothetical protein VE954_08175 [Oligoflexus sp.]|uniref:hypothetical protein n=1 Tax=Oligoflexus sp. TaxID=1971216 RepID=UPI002D47CDCB|nr:hypothetical protein [Oligoflexus sp.]HYX33079.1 hypothetical protein [Oligoflexus sp.]
MNIKLPSLLLVLLLSGCSSNLFESVADPDPADEATAAMDERKSDDAIDILEKALQKEPENWLYVSLLASAKAQKAGVDTTDIALEMAKGGESSGNPLTALFTVLPSATSDVLDLLQEATELLASIPADQLEDGDAFKISMFNTAFTALQAKYFDADGSGSFSVEELQSLDEEAAINILNSLLNAESAATIYQSAGGTGDATSNVSQIRTQIDAQPGDSQAEKLRSYLGTGS